MSVYSIRDLEHLSGIKSHTIRIWEQRHNLFSPQRTPTNIRYYNQDDLKLILNIAMLKNHGMKISKIVEMNEDEMLSAIREIAFEKRTYDDQVSALTVSMVELDESSFTKLLEDNIEEYGFEKTMMQIIYPFMRKIGILWLTNSINPAQEHFITHLVRQKVIAATDHIEQTNDGVSFFLFLPEGELHELGILFANYILRQRGCNTIFFGQTVPLDALEEVYHKINPRYVLTAMTTAPEPGEVQAYVTKLASKFKDCDILITGNRVIGQDIEVGDHMHILNNFEDLYYWTDKVPIKASLN